MLWQDMSSLLQISKDKKITEQKNKKWGGNNMYYKNYGINGELEKMFKRIKDC